LRQFWRRYERIFLGPQVFTFNMSWLKQMLDHENDENYENYEGEVDYEEQAAHLASSKLTTMCLEDFGIKMCE